ncbi:hypothetical protein M6B38_335560 [Iris pallida]|uniref:Lipoprotein n=1 Tax=Iris pallida TaxID=29817 RepID=A0AAX6H162_IRIPA|nr:hypothetical protein M6B38_335560 [Iris pallida]
MCRNINFIFSRFQILAKLILILFLHSCLISINFIDYFYLFRSLTEDLLVVLTT